MKCAPTLQTALFILKAKLDLSNFPGSTEAMVFILTKSTYIDFEASGDFHTESQVIKKIKIRKPGPLRYLGK